MNCSALSILCFLIFVHSSSHINPSFLFVVCFQPCNALSQLLVYFYCSQHCLALSISSFHLFDYRSPLLYLCYLFACLFLVLRCSVNSMYLSFVLSSALLLSFHLFMQSLELLYLYYLLSVCTRLCTAVIHSIFQSVLSCHPFVHNSALFYHFFVYLILFLDSSALLYSIPAIFLYGSSLLYPCCLFLFLKALHWYIPSIFSSVCSRDQDSSLCLLSIDRQ